MAENHVVGLLLINQPLALDFPARLHVILDEQGFFGIGAQHFGMAFGTGRRGRQAAEGAVFTQEVTLFASHTLILHVQDVVEGDGLLLFHFHQIGQYPPSQNQGHDQAHDKRAPTATPT